MADQPTTPSGSRWEPDADEAPTSEASVSDEAAPAAPIPAPAARPSGTTDQVGVPLDEPLDVAAAAERRTQLRGRAVLAGAATALTLGGGLIGFVIGHSTAGGDAGFRPAGNFQRDGGGPQLGEGQQGPPSFRDHGGDRDGDGFGPPPGFGGGSSSSGSGGTDGTGSSGTGT
jgi:hypothetical protein